MAVGEVFVDSLAVPGAAGGELDDGLPGDVGGGTGAVTPSPAETGTTAASPDLSTAAGSVAGAGPAFASDVNPIGSGTSFGSSGSALGSGGRHSTFRQLHDRVGGIAAALSRHGFERGDRLALDASSRRRRAPSRGGGANP